MHALHRTYHPLTFSHPSPHLIFDERISIILMRQKLSQIPLGDVNSFQPVFPSLRVQTRDLLSSVSHVVPPPTTSPLWKPGPCQARIPAHASHVLLDKSARSGTPSPPLSWTMFSIKLHCFSPDNWGLPRTRSCSCGPHNLCCALEVQRSPRGLFSPHIPIYCSWYLWARFPTCTPRIGVLLISMIKYVEGF